MNTLGVFDFNPLYHMLHAISKDMSFFSAMAHVPGARDTLTAPQTGEEQKSGGDKEDIMNATERL